MRTIVPLFVLLGLPIVAFSAEVGRPPAVPLITHDPYFSVWSTSDRLTDDVTRHWTLTPQPIEGLVRIDGKPFRIIGPEPKGVPALEQIGLEIRPTKTLYHFAGAGVAIDLTFLTPALPADLDLMARPVTYITVSASSRDGAEHQVEAYLGASAMLATSDAGQIVVPSRAEFGPVRAVRVGTQNQPTLERAGDATRIDWGHLYLAAAGSDVKLDILVGPYGLLSTGFDMRSLKDAELPRPASARSPMLAATLALGKVGPKTAQATLMIAYDDDKSIDYMGQWLPGYWKRNSATIGDVLQAAAHDHKAIEARCDAFDRDLTAAMERLGGPLYARIGALSHRQSLAGSKLVADAKGMPLWFPKENTSNGCIATVDVIYPQIPQLLLLNPALAKASVVPILDYAASPRWKFPFAPHDLGTYPLALGQVYGGGERTEDDQMPVEESGNMLIIVEAIATIEGDAGFASKYWPQLTKWAEFLEKEGFDPANQLCTDDFAGHLARNANLSVKAILGLACYGKLAGRRGDAATEKRYLDLARSLARKWMTMADAGDHYRLTFDTGSSWSQKYNLVWDRILSLNVFPAEVVSKELAYYRRVMQTFGLPLDSRKMFTKTDWTIWTASLTSERAEFEAMIAPIGVFLDTTPDRVAFSDFYWTDSGKNAGFHARPVVGGVFIRLLDDRATWTHWASQAPKLGNGWAPIPTLPKLSVVVPSSRNEPQTWRFTTNRPAAGWEMAGFDDRGWPQGPGGFGTRGTPGAMVRTEWNTPDIWLRRVFELPSSLGDPSTLRLDFHHDEDAEVFVNGLLAARGTGWSTDYRPTRLSPEALATLKPGLNTIAVHCHQNGGGQYIDVGLLRLTSEPLKP